eukprot:CAMPEP_0177526670 /NCGR_PEP_ID=MMETSP0369-20130122/51213_1 /TAXON_ID=447022 ORGANISM="Scrippsiella hangoei-like, Strain SHHI-4" /NCGR_SAMPLE_ID=MMETSP0369 /ASSEMBLY_ACC=CAM_ASM_000364 /LENGTH=58 /DNA_ID=CAMNT_0019006921 /DNA_START=870 /DNA_END=1046 /DNA_ORIENTATION=-
MRHLPKQYRCSTSAEPIPAPGFALRKTSKAAWHTVDSGFSTMMLNWLPAGNAADGLSS